MKKFYFNVLLVIVLAVSSNLFGGVYIEKHIHDGENTILEKIWVKDHLYKVENEEISIIIDTKREIIIYESHITRMYWEGGYDDFAKSIDLATTQIMEMMIEMMPEKERIAAREQMQKRKPAKKPSIIIEKTGKTLELHNYICQEYQVKLDGRVVETFYHTSELNIYENLKLEFFLKTIHKMDEFADDFDYTQTAEYEKYLYNGMIMKIIDSSQPFLPVEIESIAAIDKSDFDPTVFLSKAHYSINALEEILKAEFEIEMKNEQEEE